MGLVYAAHDRRLDTPVAVKLLLPEVAQMPELLEQLQRESLIGRRITHPNVCRVHDLEQSRGSDGRFDFITMELVEGTTLQALLSSGAIPPDEIVAILVQICAALEAAHAQGVVHRDLKPGNVMLDAQGTVKVLDFGLARDLHAERSTFGRPVGTPAYWSPEQARGEPATQASDLYALGRTALRMFGSASGSDLRAELHRVPNRYRAIVARCLAERPDDRFASARAVRVALEAARRQRVTAGLARRALVVGLLAFVVGGVAIWRSMPDRAARRTLAPLAANALVAKREQLSREARSRFLELVALQRIEENLRLSEWAGREGDLRQATAHLGEIDRLLGHTP